MTLDPEQILVTVAHPFGDLEVTLAEWIRVGPGPRPRLSPRAPRDRATGARLPRSAIPLRYRNDAWSRALIALGLLRDPWLSRRAGPPPPRDPSR